MGDNSLLRQLPRVDEVLAHARLRELAEDVHRAVLRNAVRRSLDEIRNDIVAGKRRNPPDIGSAAERAAQLAQGASQASLRRAVNAAGIILHTGLGRAPLSDAARQTVKDIARGYCNLQTDLETGERTHRETHILALLREITGAESALVVNNNAAATVLVLNTLAAGREVILSRGEMVEIGGSFRIPDILRLSGCKLVEIGCTNRTHLRDYEAAMTQDTGLLLCVHQSNYRIEGFASQVDIGQLAELAGRRGVACAHDLGSGALIDLRDHGLAYEPTVRDSLAAGADCALFSGDKLLGGPQCGIIVGKAEPLAAMRKNPFYRAFRVGKLTLGALEATLRLFLDADTLCAKHRVLGMLTTPVAELQRRAEVLAGDISSRCNAWLSADTAEGVTQIGGGSLAGVELPTRVVRLRSTRFRAKDLARRLRMASPPVFSRVQEDAVLLDVRTMLPGEEQLVILALVEIGAEAGRGEA